MINWKLATVYAFGFSCMALILFFGLQDQIQWDIQMLLLHKAQVAANLEIVGASAAILWVIGGIYNPDNIVWPKRPDGDRLALEYVHQRYALRGRMMSAIGGAVAAYSAYVLFGLQSTQGPTITPAAEMFVLLGGYTMVFSVIVLSATWWVKMRALELSLQHARVSPGDDAVRDERAFLASLEEAAASSSLTDRLAIKEITDAVKSRDAQIAKINAKRSANSKPEPT